MSRGNEKRKLRRWKRGHRINATESLLIFLRRLAIARQILNQIEYDDAEDYVKRFDHVK